MTAPPNSSWASLFVSAGWGFAGDDCAHRFCLLRLSGELSETVVVNPGDMVFGDIDGVLVVPRAIMMQVLVEAERIAGIEDAPRVDFKRGEDPVEVFKKHRRL